MIQFVGAGAGAGVLTGDLTLTKTGCLAGDLIAIQVADKNGSALFFDSGTNIEDLAGTDNAVTVASTFDIGSGPGANYIAFGRVIADGTVTAIIHSVSGTDDMLGRLYEFADVAAGVDLAGVLVNALGNPSTQFDQSVGTSTTITAASVQTVAANCLAVSFVAIDANLALDDFTGESGGDWTEAVAEYTSASPAGAIGLQIAALASPGTLSGGTDTLGGSASWASDTTALLPFVVLGYARLCGPVQLGASAADLYTVPTGQRASIRHVMVNNPSGAEIEYTLSIGTDAAGTRMLDQHAVAAGEDHRSRRAVNHTLEAGETIQGFADVGSTAVIVIDGYIQAV